MRRKFITPQEREILIAVRDQLLAEARAEDAAAGGKFKHDWQKDVPQPDDHRVIRLFNFGEPWQHALVDIEDYDRVRQLKWNGYRNRYGVMRVWSCPDNIEMSRFIMGVFDSEMPVHHIDRNPLNNQRANLVVCRSNTAHLLLHYRLGLYDTTRKKTFDKRLRILPPTD